MQGNITKNRDGQFTGLCKKWMGGGLDYDSHSYISNQDRMETETANQGKTVKR